MSTISDADLTHPFWPISQTWSLLKNFQTGPYRQVKAHSLLTYVKVNLYSTKH